MNCDEAARLLATHADGELGLPHASELEAHLEGCADCRAQLAALTELRAGVRMHAAYHAAPAGLATRIRAALPRDESPRGTGDAGGTGRRPRDRAGPGPGNWPQIGAAFAMAFALIWSVGLYVALPGAEESIEKELVASHARALMTNHALDVASSDQHTVKPWFNGKLDFSPAGDESRRAWLPACRRSARLHRTASGGGTRVHAPPASHRPVRMAGRQGRCAEKRDTPRLSPAALDPRRDGLLGGIGPRSGR